jgi:Txe/YoeB family toxin of Txe-Axe toxin-antitoxin module
MKIIPVDPDITRYLKKHGLEGKFEKQRRLFEENPFHPGLETELLEPRNARFWSFRVDRKYRAIFIFQKKDVVEIIDVTNHYR